MRFIIYVSHSISVASEWTLYAIIIELIITQNASQIIAAVGGDVVSCTKFYILKLLKS